MCCEAVRFFWFLLGGIHMAKRLPTPHGLVWSEVPTHLLPNAYIHEDTLAERTCVPKFDHRM